MERRDYVYFLERLSDTTIRIGHSINLSRRVLDHRAKYGRMKVLGVIHGGREKERELHKAFSHLRLTHPWLKRKFMQEFFLPGSDLLEFINENCIWTEDCDRAYHELMRPHEFTSLSYASIAGIRETATGGRATMEGFIRAYGLPEEVIRDVLTNKPKRHLSKKWRRMGCCYS